MNSPDYFNSSCASSSWYNAPNGIFGYCYPHQGNAHVGFMMFYKQSDIKEYIFQQLGSPLQAGKIYCLSFYVSRADRKECAVHSIGAYFSNNVQSVGTIGYVNATPQVINQSGFITDTTQWTEIQGCFTAMGGEQYVTIGNFNSNINTDTLTVGTSNPIPSDTYYSYYYIDDITLVDQTTVGMNDLQYSSDITIFPNPAKDVLNIDLGFEKENTKINIYNSLGELVLAEQLTTQNSSLKTHHLPSGVYFYRILVGEKIIKTDKIVIIK